MVGGQAPVSSTALDGLLVDDSHPPVHELGVGALRLPQEDFDVIVLPCIVVIERGNPGAATRPDAGIGGVCPSHEPTRTRIVGIGPTKRQVPEPDARVTHSPDAFLGVVGAVIADDQGFPVRVGLRKQRRNGTFAKEIRSVIRRDPDADERLALERLCIAVCRANLRELGGPIERRLVCPRREGLDIHQTALDIGQTPQNLMFDGVGR